MWWPRAKGGWAPTWVRGFPAPTLWAQPGSRLLHVPRWFCHVDDDNYVNPKGLLQLLSTFSPSQDIYLGRPSLDHPIEATERIQGGGTVRAGAKQGGAAESMETPARKGWG